MENRTAKIGVKVIWILTLALKNIENNWIIRYSRFVSLPPFLSRNSSIGSPFLCFLGAVFKTSYPVQPFLQLCLKLLLPMNISLNVFVEPFYGKIWAMNHTSHDFFCVQVDDIFLFIILSIWIVSFISLTCKIKTKWWSILYLKELFKQTKC